MTDREGFQQFIPYLDASDLAATRDFYVRDLGLEVEVEQARLLVLRVAGGHLGFQLGDVRAPVSEAVVLTLLTSDVDAAYQRLRRLGVATEGPPERDAHHAIHRFHARDPDGYRLVVGKYLVPPRG